jgi:hypothetical protein
MRTLVASGLASLFLTTAPNVACAATAFFVKGVEPTLDGADVIVTFRGGGGNYGVNMEFQLSNGQRFVKSLPEPPDADVRIPLNYKELKQFGVGPGVTVTGVHGNWNGRHNWGANSSGRPWGSPFALPQMLPPPKPGAAAFAALREQLGVVKRKPVEPAPIISDAIALALGHAGVDLIAKPAPQPTPAPPASPPKVAPTPSARPGRSTFNPAVARMAAIRAELAMSRGEKPAKSKR